MAHADREPSAAASHSDNPDAWVSGGHEKFETPVVPVRDGEHPAAAPVRCACCGTEKPKHGPCPSCGFGWNAPAAANHRDATLYAHGKEYVWRHSAALEGLVLTVKDVFEFQDGFTIRAEGEDGEWVIDVALPDDYGVWFAANEAAA